MNNSELLSNQAFDPSKYDGIRTKTCILCGADCGGINISNNPDRPIIVSGYVLPDGTGPYCADCVEKKGFN